MQDQGPCQVFAIAGASSTQKVIFKEEGFASMRTQKLRVLSPRSSVANKAKGPGIFEMKILMVLNYWH